MLRLAVETSAYEFIVRLRSCLEPVFVLNPSVAESDSESLLSSPRFFLCFFTAASVALALVLTFFFCFFERISRRRNSELPLVSILLFHKATNISSSPSLKFPLHFQAVLAFLRFEKLAPHMLRFEEYNCRALMSAASWPAVRIYHK